MFFKGSRYERVETRSHTAADGTIRNYKARRILPRPSSPFSHVVDDGERPDHVAYRHYRDPEVFWHIADAAVVIEPRDLTAEPGEPIPIPPAGA